jgi:hypothetical protein
VSGFSRPHQALSNAFSSAQLGDTIFATQAIQNNADLFFCTVLLARLPLDVTNDLIGR